MPAPTNNAASASLLSPATRKQMDWYAQYSDSPPLKAMYEEPKEVLKTKRGLISGMNPTPPKGDTTSSQLARGPLSSGPAIINTGIPKKRLTPAEIKEKYKSNPNLRYTWGDALEKTFPISGGRVKDVVGNAAKQAGIDPSLLYSSAMEEGMSISLNKPDDVSEAYLMATGGMPDTKGKTAVAFNEKDYPIDGFYNYGLDTFGAKAAKLAKKGYLPKGFEQRFTPMKALNEKNEMMTSAAFKTDQDALVAKAAMIRDVQDTLESQIKRKGIKLTPKQKEFFVLAGYNAGEGNMDKMITSYQQKGYLKDDKFLEPNFKPASYGGVWNNVQRRLTNKTILQQEGFLDEWKQPEPEKVKK